MLRPRAGRARGELVSEHSALPACSRPARSASGVHGRTAVTTTPDLDAPITQWTQATAFDTAKECETARTKHLPTKAGTPLPAGFVLAEEDTQAPPAASASRALDA